MRGQGEGRTEVGRGVMKQDGEGAVQVQEGVGMAKEASVKS